MNESKPLRASFEGSFESIDMLPKDDCPEIAFCGRSNSGKSSLLNAITNNSKLAKISKTPGRTQTINLFSIEESSYRIIDLPGYGYAKVSKTIKKGWAKNIDEYLNFRNSLKSVVIIMDSRHPFKEGDNTLIDWCEYNNMPTLVALNKIDKLSKKDLLMLRKIIDLKKKNFGANISFYFVSAKNKEGMEVLIASLNKIFLS